MYVPHVNFTTDPVDGEVTVEINQGPFGVSLTLEEAITIAADLTNAIFEHERKCFNEMLADMSPLPIVDPADCAGIPTISWRSTPHLTLTKGDKE